MVIVVHTLSAFCRAFSNTLCNQQIETANPIVWMDVKHEIWRKTCCAREKIIALFSKDSISWTSKLSILRYIYGTEARVNNHNREAGLIANTNKNAQQKAFSEAKKAAIDAHRPQKLSPANIAHLLNRHLKTVERYLNEKFCYWEHKKIQRPTKLTKNFNQTIVELAIVYKQIANSAAREISTMMCLPAERKRYSRKLSELAVWNEYKLRIVSDEHNL